MCQSPGELGSNQSRRCVADIMWQSAAPSQRMLSYDSKNRTPVTTSGHSATTYAAGNDKSFFAILATPVKSWYDSGGNSVATPINFSFRACVRNKNTRWEGKEEQLQFAREGIFFPL